MDYIKIRFGDEFNQLSSECESAMDDMLRSISPMFTLSRRTWKPQMDIYESSEEIIILAEIAGVDKDNLEIEINRKAVRIFGTRHPVFATENATYRLAEIQYGSFERVLFLPALIDPEVVSASYLNGFLRIRLAKLPRDRIHKIPIADE